MKIRPVAANLCHADGRTDGETEIVAFRSFVRAPKLAKLGHNNPCFTAPTTTVFAQQVHFDRHAKDARLTRQETDNAHN